MNSRNLVQEGDEYRKLFYETNAKYAVANYETAREKNMNTTMTQILKEVTEERDRVQEFMNILMDSLVRANKENSQLASKVNDLVKEKKVGRLILSSMQSMVWLPLFALQKKDMCNNVQMTLVVTINTIWLGVQITS